MLCLEGAPRRPAPMADSKSAAAAEDEEDGAGAGAASRSRYESAGALRPPGLPGLEDSCDELAVEGRSSWERRAGFSLLAA
jgi:hypothetical protein